MYFHKAPNKQELHAELIDKVAQLNIYDCLRANKSTMAWGVEARVPFLDADFLEVAMNIDPKEKMIDVSQGRIEKYILRKAFDTPDDPYLPADILWRQKEQFSDGVGYKWIDECKNKSKEMVEWKLWENRELMFPTNTPKTHEALYYRMIFDKTFKIPGASSLVPYGASCACSSDTAAKWKGNEVDDASGRSVKSHIKSTV